MHKKFTAAIASAALAMSIAICAVPGLPVMSAEVTETNPAAETKTQEQTRAAVHPILKKVRKIQPGIPRRRRRRQHQKRLQIRKKRVR